MVKRTQERPELPDNVVTHDGPVRDGEDASPEMQEYVRLQAIRERFAVMQSFWSDIHDAALDDDKFMAGEQWPEQIKKDREEDGRPVLTYNLLPGFTRQIINKVRQERPQVRVKPVESDRHQTPDVTNVQGTKDYSLADVYMGIIRNIEHLSRADHAYDTALTHAVHHGFGYIHLRTRYSDNNPFVQDLVIDRIKNSYGVLLDPGAQKLDYSDAQDGFIFQNINRDVFRRKYPEAAVGQFEQTTTGSTYEGWYDANSLRIAHYFWIEYRDDEVVMLSNGKVHYWSEIKDVIDDMQAETGVHVDKGSDGKDLRKKVKRPICRWQKMTADTVLDGPRDLVFRQVPVFPVLGDEILVDGRTRYESAIRHAKDPQRSYNYWRTAAAETVALAPRAPWVLTAKQIRGHENMWDSANTKNLPYLLYNDIEGQNPPQRTFANQLAAAELQNATQDGMDMQSIIGLHDASLGRESNEKSGKAILARQSQGSTSTFTFPDNLNRAMEALGRCLVHAIPRIYDTDRIMRIRLPDDTEDFVEINKVETDEDTGDEHLIHDLAYGQYDVVIETGPSYATQRQEAVDVQLELLKTLPPELAGNIIHLIVKNMGVPGSDEIAAMLRKMLPDELKSEDERAADLPKGVIFDEQGNPVWEESGEPYQKPLSASEQLKARELDVQERELEAKTRKADADMAKAEADMAEAQADLAKTRQGPADPAEAGQAMLPQIEQIIRDVMKEHEENPKAHAVALEDQLADALVDTLRRVRSYVNTQLAAQSKQDDAGNKARDSKAA